ncbi:MAG: DHH family phosphoesterase [Promethearchaeota archaeon]
MNSYIEKINPLIEDLKNIKNYVLNVFKQNDACIRIYTHLDADGLSAGAIIGKALYREQIPFQITILRQLEREEIIKIVKISDEFNNFFIFTDFGSGQYIDLQEKLLKDEKYPNILILDHHLPQGISNKEEIEKIKEIRENTKKWHINPYFYGIDGSTEISGSGITYFFAKVLNEKNIDLSPIAIVGATGDIQNSGENKSFIGANELILKEAIDLDLIEVINDLNFSPIKPINEAIAYSSDIELPGLSNNPNKTLKFLQTIGILIENSQGDIKTLNDLNQNEKQKIASAIIEYATLKLDIEPSEIYKKLIVNRYILKNEPIGSELHDTGEFANLLNSCGRTDNGSLGIAIAMGDRNKAYQDAKEILQSYKQKLVKALNWLQEENKIKQKEYIQYFFGEDIIPENIIGTIASMLIFDNSGKINHSKPIFGLATREDENVYKISARAHESIVKEGVNLSEVLREACEMSNIDVLGGGHPPAAGTKVPMDKIELFLDNCNLVVKKQIDGDLNNQDD